MAMGIVASQAMVAEKGCYSAACQRHLGQTAAFSVEVLVKEVLLKQRNPCSADPQMKAFLVAEQKVVQPLQDQRLVPSRLSLDTVAPATGWAESQETPWGWKATLDSSLEEAGQHSWLLASHKRC